MITDRRDLRPMTMAARDVRPGMVLLRQRTAGPSRPETVASVQLSGQIVRWELASGEQFTTGADSTLDIVGEEVHGRELATGDVVWYEPSHRWAPLDVPAADAMRRYSPTDPWVRAYVDPAWELEQARTPDRLSGCTCGGIGQTGAHTPECPWH